MPRKPTFHEIGMTGLTRQGGYVYEEFLPQLSGRLAADVYREMVDNSPIVGAILNAVDIFIRQVEWHVEPNGGKQKDTEFIEQCLHDMSFTWPETISEILSFLPHGYSYHEIVYKRRNGDNKDEGLASQYDDGRIGWRKLPIRAQETIDSWEFDDNGGIKGAYQVSPPDYKRVFIPIEKALLFRTRIKKNNPEGVSILRTMYRAWYYMKRLEEIEAIGVERDLAGLPIAWVDPRILSDNASADEAALLSEIKNIVVNVRRDAQEGIVFPQIWEDDHKLYDFDLLNTGGQRQFNTDTIITRYAQQMTMTVLADFLLLGHESSGSFALSTDKTQMFSMSLKAYLDQIAGTFNRYAIPRLFRVNGMSTKNLPRLKPGSVDTPDLRELGQYVTRMAEVGYMIHDDPRLERHLRQVAKLPEPEHDESEGAEVVPLNLPKPSPFMRDKNVMENDPRNQQGQDEGEEASFGTR